MTGLPAKYAKMGFSKGWKAFRAAGGKRKPKIASRKTKKRKARKTRKAAKKIVSFISTRRKRRTRKAGIMARGKGGRVNFSAELQNIGMGAAGAIGGTMLGNAMPFPDARVKAATPLLAGIIVSLFFGKKMPIMKKIGIGMSIGGALSTIKALAPNMALLAGEEPEQIAYTPEDVQQALITGQITPNEAAELMGASENFAGEDDQDAASMEYAPADEWQTTEDEM